MSRRPRSPPSASCSSFSGEPEPSDAESLGSQDTPSVSRQTSESRGSLADFVVDEEGEEGEEGEAEAPVRHRKRKREEPPPSQSPSISRAASSSSSAEDFAAAKASWEAVAKRVKKIDRTHWAVLNQFFSA